MPVTARLIQRLHETLGDDATDDLLAWWGETLVTRQDLDRVIEAQAQRFSAEFAAIRSEMTAMKAELRAEMANHRADLIKWMFIFWAGTVIPLAGLMVALLRL
jgi:hypothetical protein